MAKELKNDNRSIRVFISSTFRDMMAERDELMSHCWPELRSFCRERHVELTEVDLRWGIAEEQSTRKETLKLCLDEIQACRPFFIGLLGERYGWIPENDAYTKDLLQEQPWLKDIQDKSVTELEIIHGVLRNPEMAGRAFFYFRDPKYIDTIPEENRADYLSENEESVKKQITLKNEIRTTCTIKNIPLLETYPDPKSLAPIILEQLKTAIEAQFPIEDIPDQLTREARDHEAFTESRCRTYIGRPDYYEALDKYCDGNGRPLLLLGESGSGKSALIANWVKQWKEKHPKDFIFQHYIGGTADSSEHWKLITRLMSEIKNWSNDESDLPKTNDEMLRDFPLWLSKARLKAELDGVKFIVILDALNQLEDKDHALTMGWLPSDSFRDSLKLIVATLPGATLDAIEKKELQTLHVEPMKPEDRGRMIEAYLKRFGKSLDKPKIDRLANAKATANILFLKIVLDELRVTGTFDNLDERLNDYLKAPDIPSLLQNVLARYQRDYERDRPGLVRDALGLIWSARRGLTETELLQLLHSKYLPQLPLAIWSPLRAALEDSLIDRGGILNFAHDFLRSAVQKAFVSDEYIQDDYRFRLADYFEVQPITDRTCDELPWLLMQSNLLDRLRKCLLRIENFLNIFKRDKDELRQYWVDLGDQAMLGDMYLDSFDYWEANNHPTIMKVSFAANQLSNFLGPQMAQYFKAEPLMRWALRIDEDIFGPEHPNVATDLNNLATLLYATNRLAEAEPLYRRALAISEANYGPDHTSVASRLNNLALLLKVTNRLNEAEPLYRRALEIYEASYGPNHPIVAINLSNLSELMKATNSLAEAEPLILRALEIHEDCYGPDHPSVATDINNLASLLLATKRLTEAEPLLCRVVEIYEASYGPEHPDVATSMSNLALLLKATNRLDEAEQLYRRALKIHETSYGLEHPDVSIDLSNLASLLNSTNRLAEAEKHYRRALAITESSYGLEHPEIAIHLNNLARLLRETNSLAEAEPLMRRHLEILMQFSRSTSQMHPHLFTSINNYGGMLMQMGLTQEQANAKIKDIATDLFQPSGEALRSLALEQYSQGDYATARITLLELLKKEFEVQSTYIHLVRVSLMLGEISEAKQFLSLAWEGIEISKPYVKARLLWFEIAFAMLGSHPYPMHIINLQETLTLAGAFVKWSMQPVLDYLAGRLNSDDTAFLTALVAVFGDSTKFKELAPDLFRR